MEFTKNVVVYTLCILFMVHSKTGIAAVISPDLDETSNDTVTGLPSTETQTSFGSSAGNLSDTGHQDGLSESDGQGSVNIVTNTTGASWNIPLDRMKDLLTRLLYKYETRIRPRLNQSHTVEVNSSFALHSIVELDTTGQRVGVMGHFIVTWNDEVLRWNPNVYNDTKYVKLPLHNIWYPSLVISKTYDQNKVIGNAGIDRVSVSANGDVHWVPEGIFNFICEVSVKYYPFDVQTCDLIYHVSDETHSSVQLNVQDDIQQQYYIENSEWRLLAASSTTKEIHNTNIVVLTFTVQRRPDFTVYTMVFPLVALALINVFTFLVPIESGEKGSLAITLFLAYGFFITITRDGLPHNSIQVSYYVVYIALLLFLSLLTVIYVIIESRIYFFNGKKRIDIPGQFQLSKVVAGETYPEKNGQIRQVREKELKKTPMTWTNLLGKIDMIFFMSSAMFVALSSVILWSIVITRS